MSPRGLFPNPLPTNKNSSRQHLTLAAHHFPNSPTHSPLVVYSREREDQCSSHIEDQERERAEPKASSPPLPPRQVSNRPWQRASEPNNYGKPLSLPFLYTRSNCLIHLQKSFCGVLSAIKDGPSPPPCIFVLGPHSKDLTWS